MDANLGERARGFEDTAELFKRDFSTDSRIQRCPVLIKSGHEFNRFRENLRRKPRRQLCRNIERRNQHFPPSFPLLTTEDWAVFDFRSRIRSTMPEGHPSVAAAAKDAVDWNIVAGPSVRVLSGRGYATSNIERPRPSSFVPASLLISEDGSVFEVSRQAGAKGERKTRPFRSAG